MKIVTGRLIDDEVISTYRVKMWTAASWVINNQSLSQNLTDKAYAAAGLTPGPLYTAELQAWGATTAKDDERAWTFEIKITRRKWKEVTK